MKLVSKIKSALPGAARILFWVLPVWLLGYLYTVALVPQMAFSPRVAILWFVFFALSAYASRNEIDEGPPQTLEEKGMYIRGGVLRRR